jgi:DNA-binding MarR family transcriptional regulator
MATTRKNRTKKETAELQLRIAAYLDANPQAKNTDIARDLDISIPSVTHHRVRLKRTAKRTQDQMKELCARYKQFMKLNPKAKTAIAAEALGVSTSLIGHIRIKLKMAPKRSIKEREKLKKKILGILTEKPDLSNRELATIVDKPKTRVIEIRRELNLSRDGDDARGILFLTIGQQVRQLVVEEGNSLTDKKLAQRVGISLTTLSRWREKLGIPAWKKRKYTPDEKYFLKMWEDGWSDVEIAKVMGCRYTRVQKWRYRNDLIANVIHDNLRKDALCRSHTPTTLLDMVGRQMELKSLDIVWAFAALGADKEWLKKRFPNVSKRDMKKVIDQLLQWQIPRNLLRIVRRNQLIE